MTTHFKHPTMNRLRAGVVIACTVMSACGGASTVSEASGSAIVADGSITIAPSSPKLAAIGVETVRLSRERVLATFPAQVGLDEDHTVRVYSPVGGRIISVDVAAGQPIARGTALAHIASTDFAQAVSDRVKADAAAAQSIAALTRAEDLYAHHIIAQKELEQARADAAQQRAESDRARHRVELLGGGTIVNGAYVLRAPIGGTVVDRAANAGSEVRTDATTALFAITSLDTLWLEAQAPQRDVEYLRRGGTLVFTSDAEPGRTRTATVTYVSDQLDAVSHTATVRAILPNPGRVLKVMTMGEARLTVADRDEHMSVPTSALVTHGTETVVFVEISAGHFVRRAVQIGDDDGVTAVVIHGLAAGERVVTRGSIFLAAEADRAP
jgi:cobalt-zinc-cadmium efflux system membrane fusion protein